MNTAQMIRLISERVEKGDYVGNHVCNMLKGSFCNHAMSVTHQQHLLCGHS